VKVSDVHIFALLVFISEGTGDASGGCVPPVTEIKKK